MVQSKMAGCVKRGNNRVGRLTILNFGAGLRDLFLAEKTCPFLSKQFFSLLKNLGFVRTLFLLGNPSSIMSFLVRVCLVANLGGLLLGYDFRFRGFFSIEIGPTVRVIIPEIFPNRVRGRFAFVAGFSCGRLVWPFHRFSHGCSGWMFDFVLRCDFESIHPKKGY